MPDCTWDKNKHDGKSCPHHSFAPYQKRRALEALRDRNSDLSGPSCYRQGFKKAFELYDKGKDFKICFGNFDEKSNLISHMWISEDNDGDDVIFEGNALKDKKHHLIDSISIRQIDAYDEEELEEFLEEEINKHGES